MFYCVIDLVVIFMTNKKAKGKRSKTRRKFRSKGKKTVSQLVKTFEEADRVQIHIESSIHSGLPAAKFQGFAGKVVGKRGAVYEVAVRDGNTPRTLIVHPAHLKNMNVKVAG
jgi:large subunit ribosomal protein L21e